MTLAYCHHHAATPAPCERIRDCWWQQYDIQAYLKIHFSSEVIERLERATPQPKLASLLERIEAARRNLAAQADALHDPPEPENNRSNA